MRTALRRKQFHDTSQKSVSLLGIDINLKKRDKAETHHRDHVHGVTEILDVRRLRVMIPCSLLNHSLSPPTEVALQFCHFNSDTKGLIVSIITSRWCSLLYNDR